MCVCQYQPETRSAAPRVAALKTQTHKRWSSDAQRVPVRDSGERRVTQRMSTKLSLNVLGFAEWLLVPGPREKHSGLFKLKRLAAHSCWKTPPLAAAGHLTPGPWARPVLWPAAVNTLSEVCGARCLGSNEQPVSSELASHAC